jgi:hypothetical protein
VRGKRHGLDGRTQHLGFYEDEREAGLAVDSFARLHLPGTAINFPTLDELYVSRLKVHVMIEKKRPTLTSHSRSRRRSVGPAASPADVQRRRRQARGHRGATDQGASFGG